MFYVLSDGDIVGPAIAAEDLFKYSSLAPRTLALMHGPSFTGDGAAALHALADDYDRRVSEQIAAVFQGATT